MLTMPDGSIVTADNYQRLSCEGKLWEYYYENAALPAGPVYFLLKVGALPLHVTIRLEGTGLIPVITYRKPAVSANGTEWVPECYNDMRSVPLLTKGYQAPTVTSEGTAFITKTIFGFAQGNSMLASQYAAGIERVWKANTDYLIKVSTTDTTPRFRLTINVDEANI